MRRNTGTILLACVAVLCVTAAVTAQLPKLAEPFATPSVRNNVQIVAKPDASQLKAPAGFEVSLYADNLRAPRTMLLAPNGDVFVAQSGPGSVTILRDANNDGTPETRSTYAQGLSGVFGMALHDGYLYLGRTDSIVRYKYAPGDSEAKGTPEKLVDMPTGGHSTRNIIFSRDGKKMYVAVGSQSNKNAGEPPIRAAISEYNPDGTGQRIYASGLRNPVGLALQPGTDIIWTSVNERDTLGDDLVPDYITSVKDGAFYGWPYSYIGSNPDPEHVGKMPDLVRRALVPDVLITAHSAAVSVNFYTGTQFPQRYRNGAFVGLHGSWNRSKVSGYRIGFVPFQNGKPSGPIEDFVTGWIVDGGTPATAWGRPVGTLVMRDGSMLVADDAGNKIWKVRYTGKN
ncbi:MAG TPA: sorbosone dehydrogenase family protein [Terriglobia bacterium]|jgi:glucose/arabinose dehydrogenase|nr:sorbosone dehydrogenase family protein [Terriglobia bacterium]